MSRGILSAVCHVPERKRMEFTEGLKKNIDFGKVYRKGKSRANRQLVLYILSNGTDKNRLGISVSKKVGNSVVRHRIKRMIWYLLPGLTPREKHMKK